MMYQKFKIFKRVLNNRGNMMLMSYFVIIILLGLGAAFALMSSSEIKISERNRLETVAFNIAEAGIERALYDLRQDFINDPATPDWGDGDINGMAIGGDVAPYTTTFYSVPYASTSINGGSFAVEFMNVAGSDDILVRSTGTLDSISRTIQVYVRMINLSPWDNAIFAGAGAGGSMINGNVDIRGSVHVLGTGLASGDYAMDLGGTSQLVGNNYNGLDPALEALVPSIVDPFTMQETLNAELRIKNGLVGLSGSATVGEPDIAANGIKETVDGVYVTDGYGGTSGSSAVYSDNGYNNEYDLGGIVNFPSLSDVSPDDGTKTVQQYFKDNALILTTELSALDPNSSFTYSNANGSISMDGSGNLTISGRVYVQGNSVNMMTAGSDKTITYSGSGTILSEGDVHINVNLVTSGANSYPNNIMGFMTPQDIEFNEANIDVMGVFYAEDEIEVYKQTDIMGTIVSNFFDMGTNVPSIYQVPDVADNLPAGLISNNAYWYLVTIWQQI